MANDSGEIVLDEGFKEEGTGRESSSCREQIGHFRKMRLVCGYRRGFGGRSHSLRFIRASKGKHKACIRKPVQPCMAAVGRGQ